MSSSNAAAIRRRVGTTSSTPPVPSNSTTPIQPTNAEPAKKLTLQEVISVFDTRITALETEFKSSNSSISRTSLSNIDENGELAGVLDEFNHRFEILANEMSTLKDTIIKLQTYTMDVNKMLLGERVQVLSELGTNLNMTSNDDADINSVFSLTSVDPNVSIKQEPSSPTSVDMRQEVNNETTD